MVCFWLNAADRMADRLCAQEESADSASRQELPLLASVLDIQVQG